MSSWAARTEARVRGRELGSAIARGFGCGGRGGGVQDEDAGSVGSGNCTWRGWKRWRCSDLEQMRTVGFAYLGILLQQFLPCKIILRVRPLASLASSCRPQGGVSERLLWGRFLVVR